jgi:mRNA interferase ChpB
MTRRRAPDQGDVYWIDSNPISGHEIKDKHRFIIITRKEINALGVSITVPVTSGGKFSRENGLTVPILGHDTTGVALCNQVRSFDIEAREQAGTAKYVETLDTDTIDEIISRVVSIIDPAD